MFNLGILPCNEMVNNEMVDISSTLWTETNEKKPKHLKKYVVILLTKLFPSDLLTRQFSMLVIKYTIIIEIWSAWVFLFEI